MATNIRIQELIGLDRASLLRMHRLMVLSRRVEHVEMRLKKQQKVFFHIGGSGHEALGAAASLLLKPSYDWFYPYYRDRCLVLGLGIKPIDMFLQAMGKANDPSTGGREMPSHFGSPQLHIANQSSPTGTQYLQAVGTAEAGKIAAAEREKRLEGASAATGGEDGAQPPGGGKLPSFRHDELTYVSGGEGSTSEGEFYEALSVACLRGLPMLFCIHDNKYAISVPVEAQTPGGSISALVRGFPNLLVEEVDGLDPIESYRALRRAVSHVRSGSRPALVHAHVVRLEAHSASDDDDSYRPRSEKESDVARDPVPRFEELLVQEGYLSAEDAQAVHEEVNREVDEACDAALGSLDPDPATVERFVYNPETVVEVETEPREEGPPLTIVDAI